MQDHAFAVRIGSVESTQLRLCAGYSAGTYPFDKSVEELPPECNLSHNPLVPVLLDMQNTLRLREHSAR